MASNPAVGDRTSAARVSSPIPCQQGAPEAVQAAASRDTVCQPTPHRGSIRVAHFFASANF